MRRFFAVLPIVMLAFNCSGPSEQADAAPEWPSHPDFKPTPQQTAIPKSILVGQRTDITKAKYPAIDFHFHARGLDTAEGYEKLIAIMDQVGVGVICNMNGNWGETFDRNVEVGEPYKDRIIHFARLDWEGINEPGWTEKTAAELERTFNNGAHGLKISKRLGLEVKNSDGSYIHSDDPRLDAIWEMCAQHDKPVMIHVSDSLARFQPIGPDNERYEAGQWRDNPEGNYYGTDRPGPEEIFEHREKMFAKHPNTRFVNAHIAMMSFDLGRVAEMLDKYPNTDVEISARIQDLGRQPYSGRKFLIKYQDRVIFGTDGNPTREIDQFWTPHWRHLETDDEFFDHPAQMLSPLGAPLQGRWRIYGVFLPDSVLRKIYYENALKYLPGVRDSMRKQLAAAGS